jgi:chromosome segregation ATPase
MSKTGNYDGWNTAVDIASSTAAGSGYYVRGKPVPSRLSGRSVDELYRLIEELEEELEELKKLPKKERQDQAREEQRKAWEREKVEHRAYLALKVDARREAQKEVNKLRGEVVTLQNQKARLKNEIHEKKNDLDWLLTGQMGRKK